MDWSQVTLETLVDNVGAGLLEIVRVPTGLLVPVGEIVIYDPLDTRQVEEGDVVLAVGVDPTAREATELFRRAGDGQAAALIFKLEPDRRPAALLDASAASGVALMGVGVDVAWGQLHALLRTASAAGGGPVQIGPGGAAVGDLFALANAVSSMVGGATTIEDPRSTVLAYSSNDEPIDDARRRTILGRRVPEEWLQRLERDGVFRRLWAGGVVRVDYKDTEPDYRTRLAIAVRAGGEILGTIWVLEGDRKLDDRAEGALVEAGRIAALHLLRHRAFDDLERRRRADLLRSVLGGRTPPDALASSLDVSMGSYVSVVAFELSLDSDIARSEQTVAVERVLNSITVHCEAYRRQAATVAEGRVIYVLLPDRSPPELSRLTSFASAVVENLEAGLKVEAKAGIGVTVEGLGGVLRSRADADRVLRTLAGAPSGAVAHIESVRSRAILLSLRDLAARHPDLRVGKLDRLVAHDRDHQSVYVQTLRAYLDAFGDVASASARVGVHTNTFRYRLRRLTELAEIDLLDADDRLVIHLQTTFLDDDPTD